MKGMELKMKTALIQKGWMLFLSVMLLTIGVCSCSTLPFRSSEEALRIRVEEMMNARINDDWEKVYGYLDSGYQNRISKTNFLNIRREMDYIKYSIVSVEVQPSGREAVVQVKQDISIKMFDFKDQPEKQQWVKDGFSWYLKVND
jgi:hypothetical protein